MNHRIPAFVWTAAALALVAALSCDDGATMPPPPSVSLEDQDRAVLVALYEATDGPNWRRNENWLTEAPLGDWHGVEVIGERVVQLELRTNNLSGPIPPELGTLAGLRTLDLATNLSLSGPIPPQLGDLSNLTLLALSNTNLSGTIPWQLGNLSNLTRLYIGGRSMTGPIPPQLGNLSNLTGLYLTGSGLTGPIPTELGNLSNLEWLFLNNNNLTGPVPARLAAIFRLRGLGLGSNNLAGPIPSELGTLVNLTRLDLSNNNLTGSIPSVLGELSILGSLHLSGNDLTGPIPPELGDVLCLEQLFLGQNDLVGPIPPELGKLICLEQLFLDQNNLTGPVPPELGGLLSLRELVLTDNRRMSGALADSLTGLSMLETFHAGGTELCAPSDASFLDWLEGVLKRRVALCAAGGASMAYLTQVVQSRELPVPLVAGEAALLRAFVTATRATAEGIPPVRARFYLGGGETHVADIPGQSTAIPAEVDESDLSKSANAEIPGRVVQPGLEMVIEVDPQGTLDPGLGVTKRIPETGRMAVGVRAMPVLDLTVIPFLWSTDPDSSILDITAAMAADPGGHELLWDTRTLLPVGGLDVKAHEPVLSSSNNSLALLQETKALRIMEGASERFMGMMSESAATSGAAELPGRSSFAIPNSTIMAHVLGHNMNLLHAPGGEPVNLEPLFPQPDGSIGAWGYDFRDGGGLVPPTAADLMSFCDPRWIGDYHFTNALRYRLSDEGGAGPAIVAAPARTILLWGGVDAAGVPFLDPVFVVDAPPALPRSGGEYEITGQTAGGDELFSLSFEMPEVAEVADGDGGSSFAFALPVRSGWADNLADITLSGPGGSVTLDRESNLPMAILRDPLSGQVRGILRDLPPAGAQADAAALVAAPGLEVLFSRGIPDAAAWLISRTTPNGKALLVYRFESHTPLPIFANTAILRP